MRSWPDRAPTRWARRLPAGSSPGRGGGSGGEAGPGGDAPAAVLPDDHVDRGVHADHRAVGPVAGELDVEVDLVRAGVDDPPVVPGAVAPPGPLAEQGHAPLHGRDGL